MKATLFGLVMSVAMMLPATTFAANRTNIPGHPRVNEVNQRVRNQAFRINQGIANGSLSSGELGQLRQERGVIKGEERLMRRADGGHLTRADYRSLNQQLNFRSGQIFNYKH